MEVTILEIPDGIKDSIFKYRFTELLKRHNKPFSGKATIWERLQQAIDEDDGFQSKFKQFIIDEISNGKNRQIFICNFSIESLAILSNINAVQARLAAKKLPFENFNYLLESNVKSGEMVYLNIDTNSSNSGKVEKISMSFLNEITVEVENSEDEDKTASKILSNYVWIDIFPDRKYLQIKIRPIYPNYMVNMEESKRVFDYHWELLKETFGIVYTEMSETKNTLYNIFKELTEKAEAPYIDKVNSVMPEIEKKVQELSKEIGLPNYKIPVDVPNRLARLFERTLILSDLVNYKGYNIGKVGVVDRIDFSDQSGARVNALSGDEGIEIADIYFDTRETLDELKKLNKIWIRWFVPKEKFNNHSGEGDRNNDNQEGTVSDVEHIETRIEVNDNRVSVYFLGVQSVQKEVQEYVLSLFRKFEKGEIPGSIN